MYFLHWWGTARAGHSVPMPGTLMSSNPTHFRMTVQLLKCVTWNVRGLNDRRKARLVQAYLQRHEVDICMLQETHLIHPAHKLLKSGRWGEIYDAGNSKYSRGVAVLIRKGLHWQMSKVTKDNDGRYLIIHGRLYKEHVLLVNIYGPNTDMPSFFHSVGDLLLPNKNIPIIWGGDFNVTLVPHMDRRGASRSHHPRSAQALHDIMDELGLGDSWRTSHPDTLEGTSDVLPKCMVQNRLLAPLQTLAYESREDYTYGPHIFGPLTGNAFTTHPQSILQTIRLAFPLQRAA